MVTVLLDSIGLINCNFEVYKLNKLYKLNNGDVVVTQEAEAVLI